MIALPIRISKRFGRARRRILFLERDPHRPRVAVRIRHDYIAPPVRFVLRRLKNGRAELLGASLDAIGVTVKKAQFRAQAASFTLCEPRMPGVMLVRVIGM